MNARKTTLEIIYNSVNATEQITPLVHNFTYTDVASGSSDSCSLEAGDRDRKWINAWFPVTGDKMEAIIRTHDWNREGDSASLSCGSMCVDDFSFAGRPITLQLNAVAIPNSGFSYTKNTVTYEQTTLEQIGQAIASRCGVSLFYEGPSVSIAKIEQTDETDGEFYNKLCEKYGLSLKIFNDKLVVFDEAAYEAAPPKLVLNEANMDPGWSWNTSIAGSYTCVKYQYTNTENNQTFTVTAGTEGRELKCNEAADNLTEATLIALAALNNANKDITTMTVTIRAVPGLIATDCVEISGLGKLSGKYYIKQLTHSLSDGYKMELELRKVEPRVTSTTSVASTVAETKN